MSSTTFRQSQVNLSQVKFSLVQARYSAFLEEMSLWQLSGTLLERIESL